MKAIRLTDEQYKAAQARSRRGVDVGPAGRQITPPGAGKQVTVASADVVLELPWPPSVNHYWFRNANGGMRIGPRGRQFRARVHLEVSRRRIRIAMHGRLHITIIACPPDRRRRDIDNLCKAVLDALQHAELYEDDNQIDTLHIERGEVRPGGYLLVSVSESP